MRCPVCGGSDLYASHRRGILERGPLSWIGVLPYRCAECQTRFYLRTGSDARRRGARDASDVRERERPARWRHTGEVAIQVLEGKQRSAPITGETTNLSLEGMSLRLATDLPEGSQLSVALKGAAVRTGTVQWTRSDGGAGFMHGVRLDTAFGQRARLAKPWRRLRRRQFLRRLAVIVVGLVLMVGTAWGLVWLVDAFQAYDPKYYEPKDIERQLRDTVERGAGAPTTPAR
jgi:hypothetical protein